MCVVVVPALWVVEGPASDVYLFGETAGLGPDDVWFVEPVRTAFRDAGQLWCEVADAEELVRSPLLNEHGMSVEPLSAKLEARELERLRAAAQALGLDPSTLEGLRPWLAGQVLEHTHRSWLGIEAATGVHETLVGLAKHAGKPIRTELPDADSTLAFFGAMNAVVELEYLASTLDRVTDRGAELKRQVAAWCVGDRTVVDGQVDAMRTRYPNLHATRRTQPGVGAAHRRDADQPRTVIRPGRRLAPVRRRRHPRTARTSRTRNSPPHLT